MHRTTIVQMCAYLVVGAVAMVAAFAASDSSAAASEDLLPASDFAAIDDPAQRSAAIFGEAGKVLLSPRCINCHPAGDSPLQGEDSRPHEPPVVRGRGGMGVVGMRCPTCHLSENYDPGRVPGAPHWRLAPRRMAWEGLSLGEICAQIKDPDRNGNRTIDEVVEHLTDDELVAWGWSPGSGREPVTGERERFAELIRAWAQAGAACPQ